MKHYTAIRKAGWPALFNSFTGSTGGMEDWVWGGGTRFFSYMEDLLGQTKKDVTEGRRPAGENGSTRLVELLSKPPVVADLATRKFVLAKNLEQIPEGNRVPIPSLQVEEALRIVGAPKPAPPPGAPGAPAATPAGTPPPSPSGAPAVTPSDNKSAPAAAPSAKPVSAAPVKKP